MHWSDEVVDALKARGGAHVIETGTSISGIPHIGNASDVIRGDCVRKAALESSLDAKLIWVSDDSDPFRKVPKGMETLTEYLGHPVKDIPDPEGCHNSLVEHLASPFIEDLKSFGVLPEVYSGTELYRSGALEEEIKIAFERKDEIIKILDRFRKEPLESDWIPWTPICAGCGKISTTKITSVNGLKVSYVCESTDLSGGKATGCGFDGESSALAGQGKLPWRIEWAARWHHFKVTCEPFGKEHATVGGSYDTSKIISQEIFNWSPPAPVVYEFFTLNGKKISSSMGNVITLTDWLSMAEPQVLKFFMYKRLQKQRDIDLTRLTLLVDEYDLGERIYYKKEEGDEDLARLYELSQSGQTKYLNIPYTLCAVLAQVAKEKEYINKVKEQGYSGFDEERLKERIALSKVWVERYGPDYLRFNLLDKEGSSDEFEGLDQTQKKALAALANAVSDGLSPEELHKRIYEIARSNGLKPPALFKAIYRVLIGKDRGPKAASFILSLGGDYVNSRFRT
jgi:lysyl-tRNA synthetase class 1